jgi:predicted nucleic acid-binding protein
MIVVSDTSPVSNLILIRRLIILRELFAEVIVPPAVDAEVRALKNFGKDLSEYENADWITIAQPNDFAKIEALELKLDEGEAQAIALALEINCELLLIDERLGTIIAHQEGLKTIGLVGVLIKAKEKGLITQVKEVLFELKNDAGFWLGEKLQKQILEQIGEL